MISFIVPAYNEENLIGRALSGIHLAASELTHPYEIIVVDDGSTDRTATLAEKCGRGSSTCITARSLVCVTPAGAWPSATSWSLSTRIL